MAEKDAGELAHIFSIAAATRKCRPGYIDGRVKVKNEENSADLVFARGYGQVAGDHGNKRKAFHCCGGSSHNRLLRLISLQGRLIGAALRNSFPSGGVTELAADATSATALWSTAEDGVLCPPR